MAVTFLLFLCQPFFSVTGLHVDADVGSVYPRLPVPLVHLSESPKHSSHSSACSQSDYNKGYLIEIALKHLKTTLH